MKKLTAITMVLLLGYNSFGQTASNKDLENSINQLFESYAYYNRFVGSVLISNDDNIIYKKSFGYSDIDNHKKNTENSIFSIASATKPLTAVGVMKLIDDGKLTLETTLNTFFPDFIPEYSKKITVRHLLNHSSGMQVNIGRIDNAGNGLMPDENEISLDELLEKFKDSKLNFESGKGYEYNNFGYSLLAYIIESVSKKTYADYMEEAVFKPANMKNTAVGSYISINKRAFPHIGLGLNTLKKLHNPIHSSWIIGAGNINSTTNDLYNFLRALENGNLLNPSSANKLYNCTQSRGVEDSKYGFGWVIENKAEEKWIYHTGLLPGNTSIIGLLPEKNIKIIILSNATSTDLITESTFQGKSQFVDGEIIDNVIAILQHKKPKLLPLPVKISSKKNADYSKTYELDKDHSLMLTKEGDDYSLETIGKESWSVFTYQFSRNIKEDNEVSKTALFFANAMSTQNFKGLSDYANDDMKDFLGSEKGLQQLKGIWRSFIKEAGEFKSYNIYKIEGENNKTAHIRFHFEKNEIGIVLGINSANQIQGMFKDNTVKTSHITKVKLIPVGENIFFINGHQNDGMQDLKIQISKKGLILTDGSIIFKAEAVTP